MVSWKLWLKWKYDFKLCCAWKVLKCFKIVLWFFFCSVDLLDDGAKEFNLEKINGDVIEFYWQNLNILVSTLTWKNMLTISYFFSWIKKWWALVYFLNLKGKNSNLEEKKIVSDFGSMRLIALVGQRSDTPPIFDGKSDTSSPSLSLRSDTSSLCGEFAAFEEPMRVIALVGHRTNGCQSLNRRKKKKVTWYAVN